MTLSIAGASAQPAKALFAAIAIRVEVRSDHSQVVVTDSYLRVGLRDGSDEGLHIGLAHQIDPNESYELGRGKNRFFRYLLPLDRATLSRIEEERDGGRLELDIWAVFTGWDKEGRHGQGLRQEHRTHLHLERSDWVERFLNAFRYGSYEMWEVRFPDDPRHPRLEEEHRRLETAITHYDQGHYAEAFGACRDVVEGLRVGAAATALRELVGGEQFDRTCKASENLFSLSRHPAAPSQVHRREAELAIGTARTLLRWAAGVLQDEDAVLRPGAGVEASSNGHSQQATASPASEQ